MRPLPRRTRGPHPTSDAAGSRRTGRTRDAADTRRAGRAARLAAVLGVATLVVGCSHTDGRELAEPDPDLTATSPPTTLPPTTLAPFLSLKSPSFDVNGTLPPRFTCDGADVSPPLTIAGVPEDAESLVIALTDPDAGDFVHWAVTDVRPDTTTLASGTLPAGAVEYANDFGDAAYGGPCPPAGERHTYVFTVYALPASAAQFAGPEATNGAGVLEAAARLASTSAALTAAYERPD